MQTTVRKIGNSAGTILPARLLRELGIREGDALEITVEDGKLVVQKVARPKPVFDLASLVANTDFDAMRNDEELQQWQAMPPTGRESL